MLPASKVRGRFWCKIRLKVRPEQNNRGSQMSQERPQSVSCMMAEMLKVSGRAVMRKCRVNQNRIRLEAEGPARIQGLIQARKDQN